jgi:hypothetical protein
MIKTLLLALAVLGLCGVICDEVDGGETQAAPGPAERTAAMPPHERAVAPDAGNQTGARLVEVLSRPLFSPDRRPVEAARGIVGLSRLSGIVVTDQHRFAIFAAAGGGRPVIAEEGAHIGKYEVRSISNLGVTVVGPDGTAVIRPVFDPADPKPGLVAPPRGVAK